MQEFGGTFADGNDLAFGYPECRVDLPTKEPGCRLPDLHQPGRRLKTYLRADGLKQEQIVVFFVRLTPANGSRSLAGRRHCCYLGMVWPWATLIFASLLPFTLGLWAFWRSVLRLAVSIGDDVLVFTTLVMLSRHG